MTQYKVPGGYVITERLTADEIAELGKAASRTTNHKLDLHRFDKSGGSIGWQLQFSPPQGPGEVLADGSDMFNPRCKFDFELMQVLWNKRDALLAMASELLEVESAFHQDLVKATITPNHRAIAVTLLNREYGPSKHPADPGRNFTVCFRTTSHAHQENELAQAIADAEARGAHRQRALGWTSPTKQADQGEAKP